MKITRLAILITLTFSVLKSQATEFNASLLDSGNLSNVDLTAFSREGYVAPGNYILDIWLNDQPVQVNFWHIYTTYEPSQTRQANFTVIARQVLRPAMGQEFTIPLAITFGKGALTQDTGQTLNLVSLDGPNKGQPNGLRLSIKDDKGKEITFDKQEVLGDISITETVTGNVSKVYTAVITPPPGGSVKTGTFSAAIPVTVTYN
ncbi:hypothetical protein DRA35_00535 [Salmonella enterica subsp. enterica]|nr:hypothetical protein [Salmonella enterica subsp. enterica serovar Napoli]